MRPWLVPKRAAIWCWARPNECRRQISKVSVNVKRFEVIACLRIFLLEGNKKNSARQGAGKKSLDREPFGLYQGVPGGKWTSPQPSCGLIEVYHLEEAEASS